jgi:DNA polymerase elongation subunit (family B)
MINSVCFWDLETENLDPRNSRIISCSILDSRKATPKFLVIDELTDEAEKKLLHKIVNELRKFNVWVGYNSNSFDIPFLAKRLGRLSPTYYESFEFFIYTKFNKKFGNKEERYLSRDFEFLDFMEMIQFFRYENLPSYKLSVVSDYYLDDEHKIDLEGKLPIELYEAGKIDELHEYNDMDILLLKYLEEELGLIKLAEELSKLSGCRLYQTLSSSKIIENYLEKKHIPLSKKVTSPQKPPTSCPDNKGGFVNQVEAGVYYDIQILDYFNLYPSIIIGFELDPILKPIIEELWQLRKKYKNEPPKYYSIKTILNSLYGYLSYSYSRYYKPDIASRITELGREIIKFTKEYIEEHGDGKVVLVDTDSCYVSDNLISVEKLNEVVNKHFNTNGYLKLELENELESIVLFGKKKHYGYKTKDGKYVLKGIAAVKSNTPKVVADIQTSVIHRILDGESDFRALETLIKDTINNAPLIDLAIKYPLGKDYHNGASYKAAAVNWSLNNLNVIYNKPEMLFDPADGSYVYILEIQRSFDIMDKFPQFMAFSYEILKDEEFWRYKIIPSSDKVTELAQESVKTILEPLHIQVGYGRQMKLFEF